jgi:hypothetical protein
VIGCGLRYLNLYNLLSKWYWGWLATWSTQSAYWCPYCTPESASQSLVSFSPTHTTCSYPSPSQSLRLPRRLYSC